MEPFWERPAGPKTHSRRTGRKLGQLRCARQGLVRVPESNTKYGGKGGKTGGNAAPVIGPSISESSGIPKRKKFAPDLWKNASSRCSQGRYLFAATGLHLRDSRRATGSVGAGMSAAGRGRGGGSAARCRSISPIAGLHDRIKTDRARRASRPAGLMFLAITSVGWGFNWPVTKYLLERIAAADLARAPPAWSARCCWPLWRWRAGRA